MEEPDIFGDNEERFDGKSIKRKHTIDPIDESGFDFNLNENKKYPKVDNIIYGSVKPNEPFNPDGVTWNFLPNIYKDRRLNAINIFTNIGGLNLSMRNLLDFKFGFENNKSAVTILKSHINEGVLDDCKLLIYLNEEFEINTSEIDIMIGCVFNIVEILHRRNVKGEISKKSNFVKTKKIISHQEDRNKLTAQASAFHSKCEQLRKKEEDDKYDYAMNIYGKREKIRVIDDEDEYNYDLRPIKQKRLQQIDFSRMISRPKRYKEKNPEKLKEYNERNQSLKLQKNNHLKASFVELLLRMNIPLVFVGVAFNIFVNEELTKLIFDLLIKYNYKAITFTVCSSIFSMSQKQRVRFLFMVKLKETETYIIDKYEKKRTTIMPRTYTMKQPYGLGPLSFMKATGFTFNQNEYEPKDVPRLFKDNNYTRNDRERLSLMARDINPLFFYLITTHLVGVREHMTKREKIHVYNNFFKSLEMPKYRLTDAYLHVKKPYFKNLLTPKLNINKKFYEPCISSFCSAQKFHAYRHCPFTDKPLKMKYYPVFDRNQIYLIKQEENIQNKLNWALRMEEKTPKNLRGSIIVNPEWAEWLTNYPKYYTSLHYVNNGD